MPVSNTQPVFPPPSGSPVQSVWGQAVSDHTIQRFTSTADRDAKWSSPAEGSICQAPVGQFWLRSGGAWVPLFNKSMGFRLIGGVGQGIPANVVTNCTWSTKVYDDYNVTAGGIFTCPAGWAGRWRFEYSVRFPGPSTGVRQVFFSAPPVRYAQQTLDQNVSGDTCIAGSSSIILGVNAVVGVSVFQNHSGGLNCNSGTDDHFQGYYVGPS
jgi:hypothetical protein